MLQRLARHLAQCARRADRCRLLNSEVAASQMQYTAKQADIWINVHQNCSFSSSRCLLLQHPQQQPLPQLQQLQCGPLQLPLSAVGALQEAAVIAGQQWQQQRSLLGVVKHKNYQDHNTKKPKKYKMKTPSIVKRRVIVSDDGTMWRMQAGRRHKRYKKNRLRLLDLKGMVPLHSAQATKLKKLGYKRNWWHTLKA